MSANPTPLGGLMGPYSGDDEPVDHAPEPWTQDGRYIRDATGAIVVRGRTEADARRIVAAINGTNGIPTSALEGWRVQDVSDPHTRPDLEIDLESEPPPSPHQVQPPDTPLVADRRKGDRRVAPPVEVSPLFIDRRVFERRRQG